MSHFNDILNSKLDYLFGIPFLGIAIKLLLAVYGGLFAPKLTPKYSAIFTNSYFRVAFMALIIWVYNYDPTIAILVATVYFVVVSKLIHHQLHEVSATGVVTPAIATVLSGGGGPGIKSATTLAAEAVIYQAKVNTTKAPGMLTSATTPVKRENAVIPEAYMPDMVENLASV